MFRRYAIYHTPKAGTALADFGAAWLGWDSGTGRSVPHPQAAPLPMAQITETPRKYGFHGTIKPPFRLADGMTHHGLEAALSDLCATAAPVVLDGLHLARLGRFLALVPMGEATDLAQLAARVVQGLDPFRAPPTDQELAKRRAAPLTPVQEANLVAWGYPYVMDAFRFHMTLTGKLDKATAKQAEETLDLMLRNLDLAPYPVDALALLGEDDAGHFHQIHRIPLQG